MLKICCADYSSLERQKTEEIFKLRKNVFKDRLKWAVQCPNGMESDEFDNKNTKYIYGVNNGEILCGSRVIEMKSENMLLKVFSSFFEKVELPEGNYIESTRFFVEKQRVKVLGRGFPLTKILFMSLINYARQNRYDGIIAVASHPMMQIIKHSGWKVTILETGKSEKDEPVYLVLGHVDEGSHQAIRAAIIKDSALNEAVLDSWPLLDFEV